MPMKMFSVDQPYATPGLLVAVEPKDSHGLKCQQDVHGIQIHVFFI